jgi:hypothetical protein
MAHQAEAERDRRAKVINADGEFQAADKLRQAAQIMMPYPMAMLMRYLQTLTEVASERNSTIIFPLPIELLAPFLKSREDGFDTSGHNNGRSAERCQQLEDHVPSKPIPGEIEPQPAVSVT